MLGSKSNWFLAILLVAVSAQGMAQLKHALRDERARHFIPRGYVVTTNDGGGEVFFDESDYQRMVRMGANVQVVRLELGKLSSFPGAKLEPAYLEKLDSLVQLGTNVGIKTVFKMTAYGVERFSWEAFWANEINERETYLEAWKVIWTRYRNNPTVIGYDLLNEPRKLTMDISYDDLTKDYLIPYYRLLIDEAKQINEHKLFLIQSIFMNKGEAINHNQYAEIKVPINRDSVVFAPHIYQNKAEWIEPTMERFEQESELLNAPIFIGEWGFPTFATTDKSIAQQLEYQRFYIQTAESFDRLGLGAIKAWFSGNRTMQDFLPGGPSTWAIFSDQEDVGTVERKYIIDIIARPYPQTIAGDLHAFMFDHATRTLEVSLTADNEKGASQIFVGANRHYPDGFTVKLGNTFALYQNPLLATGLEVIKVDGNSVPEDIIWDYATQQLHILRWPTDQSELFLTIAPGRQK